MSTVSKITLATIEEGIDVIFIEGDFPLYGRTNMFNQSDEEVIRDTLKREDHTIFVRYGEEEQDLANATYKRVIYQA